MKTAQGARAMTKRKAGRPRIEFDLEIVEGLGRIGATAAEMANVLPASQSTIETGWRTAKAISPSPIERGRAC